MRPYQGPSAADIQKDIEDQLGITRARQRQETCTKLPAPSIGMSEAQVLSSCWGKPDHAAESITARGKQALWSYPEGYVYSSKQLDVFALHHRHLFRKALALDQAAEC